MWRRGTVGIFAVVPSPGEPSPATLLTAAARPTRATLVDDAVEHPRLRVTTPAATTATIALAWSPKWHARVDGKRVRLSPSVDQLVTLPLPAGTHVVALDFRPDAWDRLGLAVSVLTLALVALWAVRRRAQRMSSSFSRTA